MSLENIFRKEDDKRKRKSEKYKIQNNTYIVRITDGYAIKLHETLIYKEFHNGEIMVNSGGWQTVTTLARLREYCDLNLYSFKGQWCVGEMCIPFRELENLSLEVTEKQLGQYDKLIFINGVLTDIRGIDYDNSLKYQLNGGYGSKKRKDGLQKLIMLHDLRTKEIIK
jgi:hypothetical protein